MTVSHSRHRDMSRDMSRDTRVFPMETHPASVPTAADPEYQCPSWNCERFAFPTTDERCRECGGDTVPV